MPRGADARCGTPSGAARHARRGEKACDACALAKKEYDARWRSASDKTRKNRIAARAQQKAYGQLRRENLTRYDELYARFKAELTAEAEAELLATEASDVVE